MTITEGQMAPDFSLNDETGKAHKLSDYRGQTVVLYFYPKDDTPGCTQQACDFRDSHQRYLAQGAVVLGVSPDSEASHQKFKIKHDLPFPLLADPDHAVCELYGVWQEKSMYGKKYFGVVRTTFVIDPEGRVAKIFEKVKVPEHSSKVLDVLESLGSPG
ncbi:MAG: thioredoxin-dependent thiol peroxidase [Anaerolineales bacterium]|nr:thioredoxin-dependent thiol peroxidase [Anaerolineales bacterium]